MRTALVTALLALLSLPALAAAQGLRVVGWNTESGDADPDVLADYIEDTQGVALWGFSEVLSEWEAPFRRAAEGGEQARFGSVLGTTGRADRLLVVYDTDRLEKVAHSELHEINYQRRVRSPLVVHFRERTSGLDFLFMVNHLYRSRPERRVEQSRALRDWAARQTLPVIAVGDYNYDWHFERGDLEHDAGYDELVRGDALAWVRPVSLVPTHCSSYASVLDFVFAGGAARNWAPVSHILEPQSGYCPDDRSKSDHRPVLAEFDLGRGHRLDLRERSLERITRLERELSGLRGLIEQFE